MSSTEPGTTPGDLVRRALVGRRMASGRMEHTLLPKVLALPIFASDALSSVAYCVEASLLILVQRSANVRGLVMPINIVVAAVMAIVVTSYRQVVRAYPTSAGSYVVSKENLAPIFGLIAAAALLSDYVLTVAVSVSSGILAISSALGGRLQSAQVGISIGFVLLLTLVNLRGVRESGLAFAAPTYGFVLSMLALITVGLVKCVGGCPQVTQVPSPVPYGAASTVGLFVILHSFASGSSALTGTEAISNGVSAFRRPQGRNASQTLLMLGLLAVTMIAGTAFLASHTGARPSRTVSVVSEIARAVFPGGRPGSAGVMFYVLQIFTFAILILAANTSFQGFPRLSALLARDDYIPRQFENLGDRLVYSNGMLVLAVFAGLLIWAFQANVDRLIQLYVVGVFTAFTLSQIGMVRYWRRVARDGGAMAEGWRWRLAINATGAVATGVVLAIVVWTKFLAGAWIVITAMPVMIAGFLAIHRHYAAARGNLRSGLVEVAEVVENVVVLLVADLDAATAEAVGYVRSLRGVEVHPIHVVEDQARAASLRDGWAEFSRMECPLELLPTPDGRVEAVRGYVRRFPRGPGQFVTVVVPELLPRRSILLAIRRAAFRLKFGLLGERWVVVTDIPVVAEGGRGRKIMVPQYVEVLLFVSAVHDGTVRAANYARALRADVTRAVFFAMDASEVEPMLRSWEERRIPMQLDVVEAPFRELDVPILEEVRGVTARPDAVAVVVVPEVRVRRWYQLLLHGQRPLFIKRLLLFEDRVVLSSVPYRLGGAKEAGRGDRGGAGVRA